MTFAYKHLWRITAAIAAVLLLVTPAFAQTGPAGDDSPTVRKAGPSAEEAGIPTSADSWSMYGKGYDQTRFSPLNQINADNVSNLEVAWIFPLSVIEAHEGTPIMVDGTLYVTTPKGPEKVFAIDAKTGKMKWQRTFNIPGDVARFACCGIVNRGASYANGKIFFGRLDGMLMALDAETGETAWEIEAVDYKQGSAITSPPLIVGDNVITGFGGGEYGARGMIQAFNVNDGSVVWQTHMVPEDVADTWKGDSWRTGGAAAWFTGSYDAENNLIYYGTSNPSPWAAPVRGPDTSDFGDMSNLYSASTLALNPDTGEIQWHYQTTPYDAWDYDGTNEKILADLEIDGEMVPVAMQADRNGFFYVNNRVTGKLISANNFVPVNWASGVDLETGRPIENPDKRPTATNKAMECTRAFSAARTGSRWRSIRTAALPTSRRTTSR